MKIEWNGGKNPVRKGETCETIWLRSGQPLHGNGDGSYLRWSHEGNGGDIVAYEVTGKPEPAEETLRDRVAMAALTGLLANMEAFGAFCQGNPQAIAKAAHDFAGAFMAARGDA